ncbi:hypothetical protein [Nonomuraea helvata]|uniref:Uncharacterized protein n=1 Tax=Nonomuraea helvata TaxID=37484 RepID=A0ABV5RUU5_9ACTN
MNQLTFGILSRSETRFRAVSWTRPLPPSELAAMRWAVSRAGGGPVRVHREHVVPGLLAHLQQVGVGWSTLVDRKYRDMTAVDLSTTVLDTVRSHLAPGSM